MPIPRLMASPVLEPKNIRTMSLSHEVMSYHVNQPIQVRINDPKAIKNKPTKFGNRWLNPDFARKDLFGNFYPITDSRYLNLDLFKPYRFDETKICSINTIKFRRHILAVFRNQLLGGHHSSYLNIYI